MSGGPGGHGVVHIPQICNIHSIEQGRLRRGGSLTAFPAGLHLSPSFLSATRPGRTNPGWASPPTGREFRRRVRDLLTKAITQRFRIREIDYFSFLHKQLNCFWLVLKLGQSFRRGEGAVFFCHELSRWNGRMGVSALPRIRERMYIPGEGDGCRRSSEGRGGPLPGQSARGDGASRSTVNQLLINGRGAV